MRAGHRSKMALLGAETALLSAHEQTEAAQEMAQQAQEELEQLKQPVMCFSGKLKMTKDELGRGAFGIIYKGLDPETGMILAVKVVKVNSKCEAEVRNEINLLSKLNHKHIVNCIMTEVEQEQAVIAMEYCGGGSLMGMLKTVGHYQVACCTLS